MPGFEWIGVEEQQAVSSIFDNGGVLFAHGFDDLRNGVYHVREFEDACAKYFEVSHGIAVSSGTAAVKIALKAAGVKPGDEVITQAFNFIAVVEAILDVGAKPVLANVDRTLNMDPQDAESLITSRTKALLPVHMLGGPAAMDAFTAMAEKHHLALIEDACESVGGRFQGRRLGAWGDVAAISFDQGKMVAAGEGGMVLTNNDNIAKYAKEFHDHGHENNPDLPRGMDTCTIHGFNYRMTEMQAAVGKVQLDKLPEMISANQIRHESLTTALDGIVDAREILPETGPICDCFIFFVEDQPKRQSIVDYLRSTGFGTKNLPDAVKWHCAAFWEHALPEDQTSRVIPTRRLLETAIAVPIWKRKSPQDYEELGQQLVGMISK